ncbi:AAA family ATPase [Lysinibacillus telephonicus]|uniref:AAA family ATPase n=1 Tax=Lysinibacillus telephonicus TaxID=1714840 RepID=UPI0031FD006F
MVIVEEVEIKHLSKKALGISSNKDVAIKKIKNIEIENFRSLKDRKFELGDYITVVSGKNGTMKSTLMGLIAHPFDSIGKSEDPFGNKLKTDFSDVFNFSVKYDIEKYKYYISLQLSDDRILREPVNLYYNKSDSRFRLVPSGRNKGDGNFPLNTSFINLKRLFPMVDTNSKPINSITYSNAELTFIADFYSKLLQKQSFSSVEAIADTSIKSTLGPANSYYDYESISSGEDNLGHIINKLLGFMRNLTSSNNLSNGILCIDEFEASLHPVVQVRLFNFLLNWARKYNVQIILSTHSLYLISHILTLQNEINNNDIVINMISTAYVENNNFNIIKNPSYEFAYKELTLKNYSNTSEEEIHRIDVICEDDIAKDFIDKILKSRDIKKYINYITNLSDGMKGNSYSALASLCINGPKLLENCIVVFDADVPQEKLDKIKQFDYYIKLPDPDNLPIEKRIVKFILDLPGNHNFFREFNEEKDKFLSDFTDYDIQLNQTDYKKCSVTPYKNWAESDIKQFKKFITFYIRNNEELLADFKSNFIKLLNNRLKSKSLPPIVD